ncbi:phospholipase D family protein [Alkalimarinus alittae]|uniref:Phospholipase D family protein n=1 Tax=Alkalimarinus alittae TaxID=2961619 RepID=A0ABY6N2P1_9ALTE|nr:phospholipase D family protein [Alkalimarinus alittae]UZE96359.1 phospholipase D family protein [Alkalimarinus alittae]
MMLTLSSCASLPNDNSRIESYALKHTADTQLGKSLAHLFSQHPSLSGFNMLSLGQDALAARIALIQDAQRSLDLQYYIWHDDLTGRLLHNRLLDAADRGVRVRLLLDDLDTEGKEETLFALDAHPNIEIRLYNPFIYRKTRAMDFIVRPFRVNHRMHNKALIADNQAVILGGRNIGDEYFSVTKEVAFDDLDVLAAGGVAKDVSASFDRYWNSPLVLSLAAFSPDDQNKEKDLQALRLRSAKYFKEAQQSKFAESLRNTQILQYGSVNELPITWSPWVFIGDDPDKPDANNLALDSYLAPNLKRAFDLATNDLIIISPYFVPGDAIKEYLIDKVSSGVRVRILTNSLAATDVAVVYAGYMDYRKDLIKGGVELYEFRATQTAEDKEKYGWVGSSQSSLHAKSFVFDKEAIFVGSFNLDPRSISLNTEQGVYFESPEFSQSFSQMFDRQILKVAYRLKLNDGDLVWETLKNEEIIRFDKEPDTSWWKRFSTRMMSFIVPESML